MKFLQIQSKGIIDNKAMTLIGASTKRNDDSKIGQFGSGLNYSIAALFRQDIPFVIYKGLDEVKLSIKPTTFKDQEFNVIYIDGQQTSFTDSMGAIDWKGAFPFIREIYANAMDEDPNATIQIVDDLSIKEGYTTFVIEANEDVFEVMNNFKYYFASEEDALFSHSEKGLILPKSSHSVVFRHGIRTFNNPQLRSIFSYDCYTVDVNESRVVKDQYEMRTAIGYLLESMTDKRLIQRWIVELATASEYLLEHSCILYDFLSTVENPILVEYLLENKFYPNSFVDELEDEDKKGRYGLPMDLLKRFLKYAPDMDILGVSVDENSGQTKEFVEKTPSSQLFNTVADAISLLGGTDYKERLTSKLRYCKFKSSFTLGYAEVKTDTIWLSTKLDTYSVGEIAKIIIEEQEHLISEFGDCSREFQNHLFNLYFSQLTKTQ